MKQKSCFQKLVLKLSDLCSCPFSTHKTLRYLFSVFFLHATGKWPVLLTLHSSTDSLALAISSTNAKISSVNINIRISNRIRSDRGLRSATCPFRTTPIMSCQNKGSIIPRYACPQWDSYFKRAKVEISAGVCSENLVSLMPKLNRESSVFAAQDLFKVLRKSGNQCVRVGNF